MKRFIITGWLAMAVTCVLSGQDNEVYTRLTMPAVERNLSLYKGQLQFNAGYRHALGTSTFNREGSRQVYEETARTFLANDLIAEVSYGLLDVVEFSANIEFLNQVESLPTYLFWDGQILNEVNTNRQIKGPGHLDLMLSLRQPFFESGFDFLVNGGISIPVTTQYPPQPDHEIILVSPPDPDGLYVLNYNYGFKPAYNVAMFHFGLETKIRWNQMALFFTGSYQAPAGEEQTYLWTHMLYGDQFTYMSVPYYRLPPSVLHINLTPAYQVFPWFMVYVSLIHHSETGGWTEETGNRVALPGRTMGSLSAGFEIVVSPTVRFFQDFCIPVYGKENYALFALQSGIGINLVPLKKLYY